MEDYRLIKKIHGGAVSSQFKFEHEFNERAKNRRGREARHRGESGDADPAGRYGVRGFSAPPRWSSPGSWRPSIS
ncbi:hypothetical protein M8494_10180 [Serratia ureilytica]